ncbi:MAG: ribosomal L7Ae/L30e/S12e/Gadd45 family protein [Turicibacter sp.]|nr:ribosomal L7Ae/L30e/S12e/Gadd45 family protein [Turicibacter sp.]
MNKKALNFLGLMNRAGALVTGTDLVLNGVRSGKVQMVLIDASVSANTLKKVTDKCQFYHVPYIKVAEDIDLGLTIGSNRKIIGVADQKFAKALREKLETELKEAHASEST